MQRIHFPVCVTGQKLFPDPWLATHAGKLPRDMSAGINTASGSVTAQHWRMRGKCIVSANRLSLRSPSISFFPLCHGSIFTLLDNTIKAGRVLADFGSNLTWTCTEMPRTKKKNSKGKSTRAPQRFGLSSVMGVVVLSASPVHWVELNVFTVRTTNAGNRLMWTQPGEPLSHKAFSFNDVTSEMMI